MRILKISPLALPLAALAIAGCGGGGDDDSTEATATAEAPAALSKAELISQGDAICAEVNAAIGSAAASEAETSEQTVQVADLYIGMVESLKNLGTPTEEDGYAEFIAAANALSEVEGEAKLAAEREDSAALAEATTAAGPVLEEFQSSAEEYGFEECGQEPVAPAPSGPGSGVPPGVEGEGEGGIEVAPEELEEEAPIEEEAAPEEIAPETGGAGGAGGGVEEAAPEAAPETGGSSGGVGPG